MTGVLAWLGVILLAWVLACAAAWGLYLRADRALRREAAVERARQQAWDEAAADAIARVAVVIDDEYRALCEKEGGRG